MSGDEGQLALRPDQTDWEADLWAEEAVPFMLYGRIPTLPIDMPPCMADLIRSCIGDVLADEIHPETT